MPCYYDQGQEPLVHDVFSNSIPDYGSIEHWVPRYPFTSSAFNESGRRDSAGTISSDDTVTSGGTVREECSRVSDQSETSDADVSTSFVQLSGGHPQSFPGESESDAQPISSIDTDDSKKTSTTNSESSEETRESKMSILKSLVARALNSIWNGEDREFFFTTYRNKNVSTMLKSTAQCRFTTESLEQGSKEISIDIDGKIEGKADSRFGFGFPFDGIVISDAEREALQEESLGLAAKDLEHEEVLALANRLSRRKSHTIDIDLCQRLFD